MIIVHKKRNPYQYRVLQWGSIFNSSPFRYDSPDDRCSLWRRFVLGTFFIIISPFIGSATLAAVLDPIITITLTLFGLDGGYFFGGGFNYIGKFLWIIVMFLFGVCCGNILYEKMQPKLEKKFSGENQPTFIKNVKEAYRAHKEKYCPEVKIIHDDEDDE